MDEFATEVDGINVRDDGWYMLTMMMVSIFATEVDSEDIRDDDDTMIRDDVDDDRRRGLQWQPTMMIDDDDYRR